MADGGVSCMMERIDRLADDTVLQRLWRAHAAELTLFATLLVGPHDAVDVVAAAFAKMLDRDVGEIANQRAYLYRTVTNVAADQRRATRRRQARDLVAVLPDVVPPQRDDTDLHVAIARLDVRERAAVYLTYWDGLSTTEIGALLDVHPGTVRRLLARARFQLRKDIS